MYHLRVQMESVSGMYEQYEGYVDVVCDSLEREDVFRAAVRELQKTAFPDRSAGMWKMIDFMSKPTVRG